MKNTKIKFFGLLLAGMSFIAVSCADLEVENLNNPNTDKVLATPEDLKGLVGGAYSDLYAIFYNYRGNTNLEHTADHTTNTNNVRNWWSEFKVEPRPQFANSLASANRVQIVDAPFSLMNSAISAALDVIKQIENNGVTIGDDTQMVLAAAYFVKGLAGGYLASTFDQAYLVDKDTELGGLGLSPYADVMALAIADLERVIQISNANSFTLENTYINTPSPMSNSELSRLASSYAAHFLMTESRTKAANDANDWARILNFARNGISSDYILVLDNENWQNWFMDLSGLDWYFRIDHRVIQAFDPNYPSRFPLANNATVPPAVTNDKRIDLYFKYESDISRFNLTRGAQLRSHYRISRWDPLYLNSGIGPIPVFHKYINDLIIAEAEAMTGNLTAAINILNSGNRVTVGELPPLQMNLTRNQVLDIIWDERDIEICRSDWAVPFMDARRRGILQKGVLLHLPVPATELLVLNLPIYTFGGQTAADGINTSDGSGAWYTPPGVN